MLRKSLKAQSEQRLLLAEVLSKISTGITGSNEVAAAADFTSLFPLKTLEDFLSLEENLDTETGYRRELVSEL